VFPCPFFQFWIPFTSAVTDNVKQKKEKIIGRCKKVFPCPFFQFWVPYTGAVKDDVKIR